MSEAVTANCGAFDADKFAGIALQDSYSLICGQQHTNSTRLRCIYFAATSVRSHALMIFFCDGICRQRQLSVGLIPTVNSNVFAFCSNRMKVISEKPPNDQFPPARADALDEVNASGARLRCNRQFGGVPTTRARRTRPKSRRLLTPAPRFGCSSIYRLPAAASSSDTARL